MDLAQALLWTLLIGATLILALTWSVALLLAWVAWRWVRWWLGESDHG